MALEALTQQDQLDARFARAFSPIDRLGAIPVSIAELNLARQRDETARLQKLFDTVQEQEYRTGENKAYREYARETMREQQEGIEERNEKLAKLREQTDQREREINTATYKQFLKQKRDLESKIGEAYQIPMEVRNRNARSVAEANGATPKVLEQYFNLKSATDNSANLSKIKGADVGFLQQDLERLNNGYLIPKVALAKAWQSELDDIQRGLNALAPRIDLRQMANETDVKKAPEGASVEAPADPLAELRARVAARNAAAAKAVEAESAPLPGTALFGLPPIIPTVKSVVSGVGKDIAAISPLRGVGDFWANAFTGAPIPAEDPATDARANRFFRSIADMSGEGILVPQNTTAGVPQITTPTAALQSVSPSGPYGMPLSDSEIPGLKMLLKEGVSGQVFGDDQIALFFNEARRNPNGMQMKAIQLLRSKLAARSGGIPYVQPEAAPNVSPSSLFSPVPPLQQKVFPVAPIPR